MSREVVVKAVNPGEGMTRRELDEALHGCPDESMPRVITTMRGKIRQVSWANDPKPYLLSDGTIQR